MFFVAVERCNPSHLVIGQFKIEDVVVLGDMGGITGAWDCDHIPLPVPAQDHLHDRLAVSPCNTGKFRILEQFSLKAAPSERVPRLHDDIILENEVNDLRVLVIRMNLILHQDRLDAYLRKELGQFLDIETRDAQGFDLTGRLILFHCLVGLHIVCARMMQEHDVYIADVQLGKRQFDGFLRMLILRPGVDLGNDRNVLALADAVRNSLPDSLPDFLFRCRTYRPCL